MDRGALVAVHRVAEECNMTKTLSTYPDGHQQPVTTFISEVFKLHRVILILAPRHIRSFPAGPDSKQSACNVQDPGSIPGLGRSSGEGNGNPLQYSCLENPMDRGAWRVTAHGVAKSWT